MFFLRRVDFVIEENGLGFVVFDEKEKRMIGIKCYLGWCVFFYVDNFVGCNCLCVIFIYFYKGFMDNFG